jgi:predicted nucleic acid-binding protein
MHAVDTNVVVRYLTADHPRQYARARALIDSGPIFVVTTVVLETEWVLRAAYGFSSAALARALRDFAGLPTVTLEAPARVKTALDWFESGVDLADALHLAAAGGCTSFVSFDHALAKSAKGMSAPPVREP